MVACPQEFIKIITNFRLNDTETGGRCCWYHLIEVLRGNASIDHKSRTRTSFDFCKLHTEAI